METCVIYKIKDSQASMPIIIPYCSLYLKEEFKNNEVEQLYTMAPEMTIWNNKRAKFTYWERILGRENWSRWATRHFLVKLYENVVQKKKVEAPRRNIKYLVRIKCQLDFVFLSTTFNILKQWNDIDIEKRGKVGVQNTDTGPAPVTKLTAKWLSTYRV